MAPREYSHVAHENVFSNGAKAAVEVWDLEAGHDLGQFPDEPFHRATHELDCAGLLFPRANHHVQILSFHGFQKARNVLVRVGAVAIGDDEDVAG